MKFANFVYFCIMRGKVDHISKSDYTFLHKILNGLALVYEILLHNFVIFRTLFPAVLMNIRNSKVCLKRELSIAIHGYYLKEKLV